MLKVFPSLNCVSMMSTEYLANPSIERIYIQIEEDLYDVGMIGLVKGAKSYDPTKNKEANS